MPGIGGQRVILRVGFWAQRPLISPGTPAGEQIYDLTPGWYQWQSSFGQSAITWTQSLVAGPLIDLSTNKQFRGHLRSLPDGQVPFRNEQTWTWQYNPNLVGQDRLPTGEQTFDLAPRPYEYHVQLRSWQWSYNRNLVGKDQLPVGEQVFDLAISQRHPEQVQVHQWIWAWNTFAIMASKLPPGANIYDLVPRPPAPLLQTWLMGTTALMLPVVTTGVTLRSPLYTQHVPPTLLQTWLQPTQIQLLVAPIRPTAQYDWPLTPAAIQPERSITASYNPNLVGQDRLPVGEQTTALTVPAAQQPERTITSSYLKTLIGKDKLPTGEQVFDLTPRDPREVRTWSWQYILELIGQDRFPTGEQTWALPTQPDYHAQLRTWLQSLNPNLITVVIPFRQTDWPLTPAAQQPERSVTASYNKNLIAQDAMITGKQVFDLPPRDFARLFQTWISSVNLALTTAPPNIFAQARQQDWPLPTQPSRLDQTFTASFNKNLVGQDQLPFRQTDWPNPVQPIQVKDWIQSVNLALTSVTVNPGTFFDYSAPEGPQQPDRFFAASFNKNLIGKDRLPNRQQDWPLSPAHTVTPLQVMVAGTKFWLIPQVLTLPLNASRISDLAPIGPAPLMQAAVYNYNQAFIPTPAGPTLVLRTLMGTGL